MQRRAVLTAQQAVARVIADIGPLRLQLSFFQRYHVDIAVAEQWLPPRSSAGGHLYIRLRATRRPLVISISGGSGATWLFSGGSGGLWLFSSGSGVSPLHILPRHFPIAVAAALFEARNQLAQVRLSPIAADDSRFHHHDAVHMVRHDDIILNLYHRIAGGDAMQQFVFHHSPYL